MTSNQSYVSGEREPSSDYQPRDDGDCSADHGMIWIRSLLSLWNVGSSPIGMCESLRYGL